MRDDYKNKMASKIAARYQDLEERIMQDIVRRIVKTGEITSTADSLTRFDTWHRTIIENVHVYVDHKASAGDSGLNSAEVYKIRIPTDVENADQYLPPEEYAKLKDPEEHWTIQTDDQIVLGEYDQEIERPADLKDVRLRHCKVLSWSDNRFGGLPHWRIEGE